MDQKLEKEWVKPELKELNIRMTMHGKSSKNHDGVTGGDDLDS
ncbi:paeninodin family lasso peptide [Paenibacillus sp. sgz302251]